MRVRLQIAGRVRDLALVRLRVEDVMQAGHVRARALVCQRKTGAPVQFEITEQTRVAVSAWVARANLGPKDWLFPSRVDRSEPITTRQYARLVDDWIEAIGLSVKAYGTHSLRRTKASLIY